MNTPALRIENRQHQTLTPRLQQAVRLLQLSSLDFAQEVQQALDHNPFLEEDAEAPGPTPDESAPEAIEPAASWEHESWASAGGGGNRPVADGDLSLVELMPAGVSLRDHLHSQIHVMPLSEHDQALAALIIESL